MSTVLSIVEPYKPTDEDMALENEMKALRGRIDALSEEYMRLHKQRSPEFVDWLERRQGLKRNG